MYKGIITRISYEEKQTLGELQVLKSGKRVYDCKTLELPWLDNAYQKSCIPAGVYKVIKRKSAKYGLHFHILGVPNRDMILIHHGNYHWDILGCVLVGLAHKDINGDGLRDVISSKVTMKKLLALLPDNFELEIK